MKFDFRIRVAKLAIVGLRTDCGEQEAIPNDGIIQS